MPSKSRKKIKGQARKAKAAATKTASTSVPQYGTFRTIPNNSICNHGNQVDTIPDVCAHFIDAFFTSFFSSDRSLSRLNSVMMNAVNDALSETYNKFPEAVNDESNRQFVKKNIICNGTSYLLGENYPSQNTF